MSDTATWQWCDAAALSAPELATVAAWLHDMDPDYHALFHPERAQREAVIARLLKQADSER